MTRTIISVFFSLFFLFSVSNIRTAVALEDSTAYTLRESIFGKTAVQEPAFRNYRVRAGDTVGKICGDNLLCQEIFLKINRIDTQHVPVGKIVRVPVNLEKAERFVPVPERLSDFRGTREIRVFLREQYFGAYENGVLVYWGPISSGRKSNPTRPGEFRVEYKQRHKRSIKYNNAPMPYSINYDGSYFIHQQALPGHPASRGCVRLLESDAKRLFSWMKVGDSVTIE